MGFMSTSRNKETPLEYMDRGGKNVLWALKPMLETDEAYHIGADVAMLSQFSSEAEVLFPPCTMLSVRPSSEQHSSNNRSSDDNASVASERAEGNAADGITDRTSRAVSFTSAVAIPSAQPFSSDAERLWGNDGAPMVFRAHSEPSKNVPRPADAAVSDADAAQQGSAPPMPYRSQSTPVRKVFGPEAVVHSITTAPPLPPATSEPPVAEEEEQGYFGIPAPSPRKLLRTLTSSFGLGLASPLQDEAESESSQVTSRGSVHGIKPLSAPLNNQPPILVTVFEDNGVKYDQVDVLPSFI